MPVNFSKIRELRDLRTLNQQEAADRAGFGGTAGKVRWNDIENGKYANLRIDTLEVVAWVLGVQVAELLIPIDLAAPMKLKRSARQNRRRPSSEAGSNG